MAGIGKRQLRLVGKNTREMFSTIADRGSAEAKAGELSDKMADMKSGNRTRALNALDKLISDKKTRASPSSAPHAVIEPEMTQMDKEKEVRRIGKAINLVKIASEINDPHVKRAAKLMRKHLDNHLGKHYDDVVPDHDDKQ